MNLQKRDCGIKVELVPYGGGWEDVYLDIGGDHHYFVISTVMGCGFERLMQVLYYLYPNNGDPEEDWDIVDVKEGILNDAHEIVRMQDVGEALEPGTVLRYIPWKARFTWDEEGSYSTWELEREPNEENDFVLHLRISFDRGEKKQYSYQVRYADLCYAVADAATRALKKHGIYGYHHSVYCKDMNLRHLLFLKAVALDNYEARTLTCYEEKGKGETTNLQAELELLLFDM